MITLRDLGLIWGITPSAARRRVMRETGVSLLRLGRKWGNTWVLSLTSLASYGVILDNEE